MQSDSATSVEDTLSRPVFADGVERRFGGLTARQVEERAAELRRATGFGHGSRVGTVALAWRELASVMREHGATTVGDLPATEVAGRAGALWVLPPGGSLLR